MIAAPEANAAMDLVVRGSGSGATVEGDGGVLVASVVVDVPSGSEYAI